MIIHKSIVHVLDKNNDGPILNDYECKNSLEVDKFFQKIINRVSKDDDLRKAEFNDYNNNIVKNCCEQIIYDEDTFLQNSKEIASYLFEIMQQSEDTDALLEAKSQVRVYVDDVTSYGRTNALVRIIFQIIVNNHEMILPDTPYSSIDKS